MGLFLLAANLIWTVGCGFRQVANPVGYYVKGPAMHEARNEHTATLLEDGNVLIAGGYAVVPGRTAYAKSAELYLSQKNKFVQISGLNIPRAYHAAVKLENGKVLFFGGEVPRVHTPNTYMGGTDVVEEYNPQTRTFSIVGKALRPRRTCQAVLLDNGKVFIYGGATGKWEGKWNGEWRCELYDPMTHTSIFTSRMHYLDTQAGRVLAKLPDGRVFIKVGKSYTPEEEEVNWERNRKNIFEPLPKPDRLGAIEIYDPKTDRYELKFILHGYRHRVSSMVLPDGRVLLAGGFSSESQETPNKNIEIYDSGVDQSKIVADLTSMAGGKELYLLNKRYVMVSDVDAFDIKEQKTMNIGDAKSGRADFPKTKLADGDVLITGGNAKEKRRPEIFKVIRE